MSCQPCVMEVEYILKEPYCIHNDKLCRTIYNKKHEINYEEGSIIYSPIHGKFITFKEGKLVAIKKDCRCIYDPIHEQVYEWNSDFCTWDPKSSSPELWLAQIPLESDSGPIQWKMPSIYKILPDNTVAIVSTNQDGIVIFPAEQGGVLSYMGVFCIVSKLPKANDIYNPTCENKTHCVLVNVRIIFAPVPKVAYLNADVSSTGILTPVVNKGYTITGNELRVIKPGTYTLTINLQFLTLPNVCPVLCDDGSCVVLLNGSEIFRIYPSKSGNNTATNCMNSNSLCGIINNFTISELTPTSIITVDPSDLINKGYTIVSLKLYSFLL